MKLPALPVGDHLSTLNFEAIQKHDNEIVQIAAAAGSSPVRIAYGIGTVTFAASTLSAISNVTHGLGTTPQCVQVTPLGVDASFNATLTGGPGATTFPAQGSYPGALTGTYSFYWLAIG